MGQTRALMTKNWILYKRGCCGNILQILIPILFTGFIVMVSKLSPPTLIVEQSYIGVDKFSSIVTDNQYLQNMKQCGTSAIALIPTGDPFITKVNTMLTTGTNTFSTMFFATQAQLQSYIRSQSYSTSTQVCWALVVESTTPRYQYKLRFNISNNGDSDGPSTTLPLTQDVGIDLNTFQSTLWRGMIGANNLICSIILQIQSVSLTKSFQARVSPQYQQQYLQNNIYTNLVQSVGTIFLLPLLIIYLRQASSMLSEKESKVRESMRIMGMKMGNYYFTWFLRYFIVYAIIHIICSAIISYQCSYIPFYVPLVFYLLFDILIIIQNFFVQVFISRAKLGVIIILLFFVVQYVIFLLVSTNSNPTTSFNNTLSIVPHVAYLLAFSNLLYMESKQIQASFTTVANNYTISTALISLAANIIVYLALLWYLDQVVPSQWGAKRHPLFCCFEKTFSRPDRLQNKTKNSSVIEKVDNNLKSLQKSNEIIEIIGLKKQFNGGDTIAVDNLNINIYKNQIFALLGHNGAGKTTTISMLTGLLQPTEGFVSVFGQTEMENIRKKLGLCPQHDTLYQDLTVEQHLNLFATFKGLDGQQKQLEVEKLIHDVNLSQKRDQYTKNLSGGQKRRLSVALAFAGKSKVIILDEPTSGMDTSARRYIWDLLKTYKNDRIIILTTHFMDQADFLGDRIGIMGGGKLLCCGSSIFLKSKFGIGYNLTFVKQSPQISSDPIINLVQRHIPNSQVLSNVSSELSMQLPLQEIKKFSTLFNEIDFKKPELRIYEYGISVTTLEEVFLKVAEQDQQQKKQAQKLQFQANSQSQLSPDISAKSKKLSLENSSISMIRKPRQPKVFPKMEVEQNQQEIPRYTDECVRFNTHFGATFLKRLRVIKRDLKTFLFELILPLGVIICALFLMKISFLTDQSAQTINLYTYLGQQNPVVLPIGSTDSTLLGNLNTNINGIYTSNILVHSDASVITVNAFDQNYLFPYKKSISNLLGGLYFLNSYSSGPDTLYPFYVLANTKSPTSPIFLHTMACQAIINTVFGKTITINPINAPLPLTYNQLSVNSTISGFLGAFVFTLALSFKFASIISFIVKQKQDRVKHQQIVSGMKISAYWFANFVYDYLLYLIVALPAAALCKALNITSLATGNAYLATWLLFAGFGLAYIPFTYIIAFMYNEYGSAQSYYFFFTFLVGGMLPIITLVLRIISTSSSQIGRYIAWALRILPSFCFGQGIINMGSVSAFSGTQNNNQPIDPLALQISLAPILYLFGQFILYTMLLFIIEAIQNTQSAMRCLSRQHKIEDTIQINQTDVMNQYRKANDADPQEYQILTQHLRKVFMIDGKKQYKVAVDNLSFGIKKGEVFGLLGVNGAGKSTTFKMLSGQVTSTSGDSYFCGYKISENLDKVRESLGYCPQFDALVETLTVRQQIQLYYDLKSLSSEYKDRLVTEKIKQLDLQHYQDKLSGTLSGGNKRKLSVALAMIGNPKIIFLDEPSTGMDPKARRFMWKVISKIATEKKQSTIILTTHSMEEAESLSTRLAIMVKGNFQCIGTPQHIKSKYGEGMQIQIKFMPIDKRRIDEVITKKKLSNHLIVKQNKLKEVFDALNADHDDRIQVSEYGKANHIFQILKKQNKVELSLIIEFLEISFILKKSVQQIKQAFGQVQIIETLQSFLRLKIKKKPNIGKLFDFFESKKDYFGIQQYTIKQASVEQIFNKFAQNEGQSQNNG